MTNFISNCGYKRTKGKRLVISSVEYFCQSTYACAILIYVRFFEKYVYRRVFTQRYLFIDAKISICLLEQNGVKTNKRTVCAQSEQIFWPDFGLLSLPFSALCNAERVDTIHVQNNKHTITDQCSSTVLFRMD